MANNIVFKKGTAKQFRRSITSARFAHKLSKAIVRLENDDVDKLVRIGKVKKISVMNGGELYTYRVTPTERILFSSVDGKNYVHDVVSASKSDKVQSLLSLKEA